MTKSPAVRDTTDDTGNAPLAPRWRDRVGRAVKVIWLAGWLALATGIVFPPIALASLWSRSGNSMFRLACLWAWIILKITRTRVSVRGLGKIDRSRAYMIIANHQSHFDGPALALGLRKLPFRWIAKQELLRIPVFGYCLKSSRNIFIDRSDREKAVASIQAGLRRLPHGVSVMCFAEGTRSDDGRVGVFKKGGFMAAVQGGLPILPVAICGSRNVLPKGSIAFRSGCIKLRVGEPIETQGVDAGDLESLIRATRAAIFALGASGA